MANAYFNNNGHFYAKHIQPVLIDCNFVVAATNASGITSLKGPGVSSVYMHTSTTPTTGSPNPGNGVIQIKLQDNYNFFYGLAFASIASPNSGSNVTSPTISVAYT